MKSITIKGLADFILCGPSAQETTLRDYKYPSKQQTGKAIYYKEVTDVIRKYFDKKLDQSFLEGEIRSLENQAAAHSSDWHKARLKSNARALQDFLNNFSKTSLTITGIPKGIQFERYGLKVNAAPDLRVKGSHRDDFIKFDFSTKKTDGKLARYLCEGMCLAANESNIESSIHQFKVWDVNGGKEHCFPRCNNQSIKDLEAACRMVNAVWDHI